MKYSPLGLVADIDWRLAVAEGLGVHGLPYGVAQRHVFALVLLWFRAQSGRLLDLGKR
jgi:hypothetical protein